jgi:hypothetical protein
VRLAWRPVVAALVVVASLSGCASRYKASLAPGCRKTATLVLLAQSVPSADRVPCIATLPAGWTFRDIEVRRGHSTFTLGSDRAGDHALDVDLVTSCDVRGATQIASDEPGTRRYERVRSVVGAYKGTRSYLFPGGCVTYRFNFSRSGLALVNEVSLAVGFVSRAEVARLASLPSV